jgi:hypothetical protein
MARELHHVGASGPEPDRRASFGRGFRNLNPLVLVAAIALAALALVGLELLVEAGVVAKVPEGHFVRHRHDDNGHVTYVLANLHASPPATPTVYLTGGSATMECFLSEESLGYDVSQAAGETIGAVSLAAHSQSFAESLALVENLPSGEALVAVGLAPMRFTNGPGDDAGLLKGEPFFLRSARVRRLLEAEPVTTAPVDLVFPGVLRFIAGYVRERRADDVPLWAEVEYHEHYTIDGPVRTAAQKREMATNDMAADRVTYDAYADYNFAVLEELVRLAHERGFVVAFFDQPLNEHVLGPEWDGVVPSYQSRALAIARAYGVAYLDVEQTVALADSDYLDVYHLVTRGRLKWQPEFARQLAEAWTDAKGGLAEQ